MAIRGGHALADRRMKLRGGVAGVALALAVTGAAFAQRAPESILPPGFGEPARSAARPDTPPPPASPDEPAPPPTTDQPADAPRAAPSAQSPSSSSSSSATDKDDEKDGDDDEAVDAPPLIDLPPAARRSTARIGLIGRADGGVAADAFGALPGPVLKRLVEATRAPIASRWGSILLRRTLVSTTTTPKGVRPADWVAARAWLLLRMGEAENARALVSRVDADNATRYLAAIAVQAALATADPASACPWSGRGGSGPDWSLIRAMCAGLSGESGTAGAAIDEARRRHQARGVDLRLAEKVAAAGSNTRRAVTIQWDDVTRLTAWRYGLAAATNVPIPPALLNTAGAQVYGWLARAPLYPPADRLAAAERAATMGVFSNAALVDLYGAAYEAVDPSERNRAPGNELRALYEGKPGARADAIAALVGDRTGDERYAKLILAARAAALVDPASDGDADVLVAAMLSAGYDTMAARWAPSVERGSLAWGLLAVGAPGGAVSAGDVRSFIRSSGGDDGHRGRLAIAALAGLGRLTVADAQELAEDNDLTLRAGGSWGRAIAAAAARGEAGTVALLTGAGLQASRWANVPAAHLYEIVAALTAVGREADARMIAAEALTRA